MGGFLVFFFCSPARGAGGRGGGVLPGRGASAGLGSAAADGPEEPPAANEKDGSASGVKREPSGVLPPGGGACRGEGP